MYDNRNSIKELSNAGNQRSQVFLLDSSNSHGGRWYRSDVSGRTARVSSLPKLTSPNSSHIAVLQPSSELSEVILLCQM